ncbi:MAG TPA: helix-turn-helix transcriptional regulator [Burkholderiaceae bacterium]
MKPLLGEFVRSHRERLSPEQVGLPRGVRRRAVGLRREEVAALCGISPTWLTWIEQGRASSLSSATLARLAEALVMTPAERAYLFDLAALRDPEAGADAADALASEALQALLKTAVGQIRSPAYVIDRAWDAVAWNRPAAVLFDAWLGKAAVERNLLRYTFLDPGARRFIDDWPERARRLVAEFRADRSASLQEPATRTQIEALRRESADFDRLWRQQDVLEREGGERVFEHPQQGRVSHRQLTLRVANAPQLKLVMLL